MELPMSRLTAAQRKAIYGVMTAILAGLLAFGVITADEVDSAVSTIVTLATALTTLLAYSNTHPEE
jgi:hypothetical protein